MTQLRVMPPPETVRDQMAAIPDVRFTAVSVTGQAGPLHQANPLRRAAGWCRQHSSSRRQGPVAVQAW